MNGNVVLVDTEWKSFLNRLGTEFKPKAVELVNQSAQFAKRNIVEVFPRRTGQLRNSYNAKKTSELSWIVSSSLDAARVDGFEYGTKAHTIYPKRAKMLTIPLRDDVLVASKARIQTAKLQKLFSLLKNRKGLTTREVYDQAGIALAKKAKIPSISGKHLIRDRITPNTSKFMNEKLVKTAKELGFD